MATQDFLSVLNIAQELDAGIASVKFILKRFKKWFPGETIDGQTLYSASTVSMISQVLSKLNAGWLPSRIESELAEGRFDDISGMVDSLPNDDIRLSKDGLNLLRSLFNDIGEQQRRIAQAHEKRAAAEERKAVAIEKRADAEEKKAQAMNNIASALQEMNQLRGGIDPATHQIAHQAAAAIVDDENLSLDMPDEQFDIDHEDYKNTSLPDDPLDDLSTLIDQEDILADIELDEPLPEIESEDLEEDLLSSDLPEEQTLELDDLSALVSEEFDPESDEPATDDPDNLDDLSLLIDDDTHPDSELDDLSKLIDDDTAEDVTPEEDSADSLSEPLDDLSLLIDKVSSEENSSDTESDTPQIEMDDLSLLIDSPQEQTNDDDSMDDLAALIDMPEPSAEPEEDGTSPEIEMDDLSKLIDPPTGDGDDEPAEEPVPQFPKVELDLDPQNNIAEYKAAIMKIILGFKNEGIEPEETTQILNHNNIKTLSGKPEWGVKAIVQIYKFIDSAS